MIRMIPIIYTGNKTNNSIINDERINFQFDILETSIAYQNKSIKVYYNIIIL